MSEQPLSAPAAPSSHTFIRSCLAGGAAGTAVDIALFPLDTIKTRLQSSEGFWKAGGFRGIYRGLGAAAVGSAPGAAAFFSTYDSLKRWAQPRVDPAYAPLVHMAAASAGEAVACLVRVPTENVKQNVQAGRYEGNWAATQAILSTRGIAGFYTGFLSTIFREIPFSFIQFPIYEACKSATAGSFAGAIAAAITTPLDVIKTRLILQKDARGVAYRGIADTAKRIIADEGPGRLLSGLGPRVMWISIGGFVFFGVYDAAYHAVP